MNSLIPEKLPDSIDNAIFNLTDKPTKEIGEIFYDLLSLAFGGIHFQAEKRRIRYKYSLEEFEKSCKEKIEAIPQENRVEPSTKVACQLLEDSKYCVEDKEIREMFVKLIAATMDSRVCDNVHPSFSAIIKQMSPQDVLFFKRFKSNPDIPIGNFRLIYHTKNSFTGSEKCFKDLLEYACFENKKSSFEEVENTALILSMLERLGLIKISLNSSVDDDSLYQVYKESDIFEKLKDKYNNKGQRIRFMKGSACVTILGRHLLEICYPDEI